MTMILERRRSAANAKYFDALTGIRGVAAFSVFLFHWTTMQGLQSDWAASFAHGYLGVDMFFILSGFVMSHAKYDTLADLSLKNYLLFLRERAMRLMPAHTAVLVIFTSVVLIVPSLVLEMPAGRYSLRSGIASLFLIQVWVPEGIGWNVPGWSISAELAAYVALPIVLMATRAISTPIVLLAGAGLAAVLPGLYLMANGVFCPDVIHAPAAIVRVACEFTEGALLYRLVLIGPAFNAWWLSVGIAVLLAIATIQPERGTLFFCNVAFGLIVLLAVQEKDNILTYVLNNSVVKGLGRISFSFYLVHWPIIVMWHHQFDTDGRLTSLFIVYVVTVCVGLLLYWTVERPSQRWAKHCARDFWRDAPKAFAFDHEQMRSQPGGASTDYPRSNGV